MPSWVVSSYPFCESSFPLACLLSLYRRLHLNIQLRRWFTEVAKQRRPEPTLHLLLLPAIDIAATLRRVRPASLQSNLGIGKLVPMPLLIGHFQVTKAHYQSANSLAPPNTPHPTPEPHFP